MNKNVFYTEQIITYLGNKRNLIKNIEEEIIKIKEKLNKEKIDTIDLFSGSGIVARMLKSHSRNLHVNDLEKYSYIINDCYLTNSNRFDEEKYNHYKKIIDNALLDLKGGIITKNYAPKDEEPITSEDRVFYTIENAKIIDTIRSTIDLIEKPYQKFFLAPLLYEASVHCNTSGVFKGFYKSKETQIGKYGGDGENALERIKGKITLKKPIFSDHDCEVVLHQEDANQLVKELPLVDVIYMDPPYNQHPYGSNYFMLNTIIKNKIDAPLSKVAGIPENWNKSDYNKKNKIKETFEDLVKHCNSRYLIISYNNEGFLTKEDMIEILSKYGEVELREIKYPTFRASRNLKDRAKHVLEYLFIVKMN